MLIIATNIDINNINSEHIWLGIQTWNVFNAPELLTMNAKIEYYDICTDYKKISIIIIILIN